MSRPGTEANPLRVAVVGSGPAGFFAVERLFKVADKAGLHVSVDMLERLPMPYGLVRFGVAPDHAKIKGVTKKYDRLAADPRFRFWGNVEYGADVELDDLKRHVHAVVFATGAQTDRRLGIPGEDLARSHPATEFVAWYNGHPDFRDCTFDLSVERAVVVGIGNVAVDVARVLAKDVSELRGTDIADHALEALAESRVREVVMLGRRGPTQAAFTNPEVKELGELEGADVFVPAAEAEPDPVSLAAFEAAPDKETTRKLDIVRSYADRPPTGKARRLVIRFLTSPVEILDDGAGGVGGMRLVRNRIEDRGGRLAAVATGAFEDLDVGLVFRSVGYRGVALPEVPFRDDWGTVPNEGGRVATHPGGDAVSGLYVAGWIKRGPSGVIGTNKPDAAETVDAVLEDAAAGRVWNPEAAAPAALEATVRERAPRAVSLDGWRRIDAAEVARGEPDGRPRVKFTRVDEALEVAGS